MYTENDERREKLEALQRAILDGGLDPQYLNRQALLLDIVRYLQTCVPEETANRVNGYLGMLP